MGAFVASGACGGIGSSASQLLENAEQEWGDIGEDVGVRAGLSSVSILGAWITRQTRFPSRKPIIAQIDLRRAQMATRFLSRRSVFTLIPAATPSTGVAVPLDRLPSAET